MNYLDQKGIAIDNYSHALQSQGRAALSEYQFNLLRNSALEEAANLVAEWESEQYVRLQAGEMSAQEMRTVQAIIKVITRRIREIKNI